MRMITVQEMPEGWSLWADNERRPIFKHRDGRQLEPKAVASEGDAQRIYRALKLEEDRRVQVIQGAERSNDWVTIWSARAVIGFYFNKKASPEKADNFLHEETDELVRKEQRSRARLWIPGMN